jgi:hypothetical protein
MPRSRGLKPENPAGRDAATGNDFFSAVSAERDTGRTEEAGNGIDHPVEVVSLDPSLDGEAAVAALSQAVAAFIAADQAPRNPDDANAAGDTAGGIGHADPAARMRAALPGLATIASNATSGAERLPDEKSAAVMGGVEVSAHENGVTPERAVGQPDPASLSVELVTPSLVRGTFQAPAALLQSGSTATNAALVGSFPESEPAASPVRAIASNSAEDETALADQPQQSRSGPMARIVDPLRGAFPAGAVAPIADEAGAMLSRQLAVSSAGAGAVVGEPGLPAAPVETGDGLRPMPQPAKAPELQVQQTASGAQLPEVLAEAGELSRQTDEKAAPAVRPSRQPSETGSMLLSAMKPGEAMQAAASGPALPATPAALIFAQLPGISGVPAPSTAEPLRPLSSISADFSTGAPLRHLEIVLAPPELGTVRVVITREDGEMRVEMVASTSQAVDILEAARESMAEAIRETGMRTGSIEIRQDLHAARPSSAGDLANGSAWHGKQEQGRHQGTENWQAGRAQSYAQSYAQAGRVPEGGAQNRGLIL